MSATTPWIKASASGSGNQCVEMRRTAVSVEIRDSKHRGGPTLSFAQVHFAAMLDCARTGKLDDLAGQATLSKPGLE